MRYIKAKTLNSAWIIEEDDAGNRKVVDIIPDSGEMRDVHRSILSIERSMVTRFPSASDIVEQDGFDACIWGGNPDGWHSSRVQSVEDIEWHSGTASGA